MRIVLVEDNEMLAKGIEKALQDLGHSVDHLADGSAGEAFLSASGGDLAIIDVNLPGMDGFEIVRALRRRGDTIPVLMLTARGEIADRVKGLDSGADDYLVKPFEMAELHARIRALTRRHAEFSPSEFQLGTLRFDSRARRLYGPDGEVDLPRREMALFEYLVQQKGRIVSKDAIATTLYGTGSEVEPNAVELLISRLRRKLCDSGMTIRTARGLGYLLDADGGR